MAPASGAAGAAYVKAKLQESDSMGKVETSAANLLSECSAVLIRRLVEATSNSNGLTMEALKATIERDDQFKCFRSALDGFEPVKLPKSLLSAHLKHHKKAPKQRKTPAPKRKRAPETTSIAQAMEYVGPIDQITTRKTNDEIVPDEEDYD